MTSLILGTAGHIDHGKTALVRALTGVDTDRLQEEKERGITIELGFAELLVNSDLRFGVVDVPGHEAFVRAMVAGAAGMDIVLLVVAADEGVMPQTREHLAIIELLDVPELLVAITKVDMVDEEWLELVDADIQALLEGTRYRSAGRLPTSAKEEIGLAPLIDALKDAAERVRSRDGGDLVRLPLDRVFTIQGAGTVVTGTLWTGTLRDGDRVKILPLDLNARVRGLQVHDRPVGEAVAGDRTAVAITGQGADRARVVRGTTLVKDEGWSPSWMVTALIELLVDQDWSICRNQRVHVHHGTSEVRARCSLLEVDQLNPGESGWVQLRLEQPLAVRGKDRFVLRAYSPVTTIGGGAIVEPTAPKRNKIDQPTSEALFSVLRGDPLSAISGHLDLRGWKGADIDALPVQTGLLPATVESALAGIDQASLLRTSRRLFAQSVHQKAEDLIRVAVQNGHTNDPLRTSVPLSSVRAVLPKSAPSDLADAIVTKLLKEGVLESANGGVRDPSHRPTLSQEQEEISGRLKELFSSGGLAAPTIEELPTDLRERPDIWSLIKRLESIGALQEIAHGIYVENEEIKAAEKRVTEMLSGQTNLGPADFKEALPVTRKRLIPLLNYFDGKGTTVRHENGRDVPERG